MNFVYLINDTDEFVVILPQMYKIRVTYLSMEDHNF